MGSAEKLGVKFGTVGDSVLTTSCATFFKGGRAVVAVRYQTVVFNQIRGKC